MIIAELLEILACPVCKADVALDETNSVLRCVRCSCTFPILDGIPNMLPDEPSVL